MTEGREVYIEKVPAYDRGGAPIQNLQEDENMALQTGQGFICDVDMAWALLLG